MKWPSANVLESRRSIASERVDLIRMDASRRLDTDRQAQHGQYFTPAAIARMMAGFFGESPQHIRILDAGAGVGSLFSACIDELCDRAHRPKSIHVVAYEIDPVLCVYLHDTMNYCAYECARFNVEFRGEVREEDFLASVVEQVESGFFATRPREQFEWAILNPPYYKIGAESRSRRLLERLGLASSNIYAGFLAAALQQLANNGEIVAITPRSFCNGPYFREFRKLLLSGMTLRRLHVFDSRQHAFRDQAVLQENVIFRATREKNRAAVQVSSSQGIDDDYYLSREAPYSEIVQSSDPDCFIRLLPDELERQLSDQLAFFSSSLAQLGLSVSTGRVVDFRAREHLRMEPTTETVPLIYPRNLRHRRVEWPRSPSKKPAAIVASDTTSDLLVPAANYVLVKRFSAKEEKRRIVAAVFEPSSVESALVGFENHLNYFHANGQGLDPVIANGLELFLNSTLLDRYFRQFSGHTQVNATDLRSLQYPTLEQLEWLGRRNPPLHASQDEIDDLVCALIQENDSVLPLNPVGTMKRIDEALQILKQLGFPRQQLNERSALTLLALLNLRPKTPWSAASDDLWGITPMMEFFAENYGKRYKPNTRESVRRLTIHQFLDAGLVVANPDRPDRPDRPTNSGKSVYKIESSALKLLRCFGSPTWTKGLRAYLASVETLNKKYAREREMKRIPVKLPKGETVSLSPGGQNVLVKQIVEEFAPRFTPGGRVIYVGDTDDKLVCVDNRAFRNLGLELDVHGKMPDVMIHFKKKNWLVLVEAVTSHGPVNPKRHAELQKLFASATAGLVFVTAFLDRRTMVTYLDEISWETEVWVAESPSHMIHFNGERFLGPY